jgi:hypothetical protein
MHSESHTAAAEKVSQDTLEASCKLTLSRSTPEAISSALYLNVQTVIHVIDRGDFGIKDLDQEGNQCEQSQLAQDAMFQAQTEVPTFIYSHSYGTDQLQRTNLVTGEHSCHRVPSYTFKPYCCWSEVPEGSLLFTGGEHPAEQEVVRIDTRREFAVSHCAPMINRRNSHAAASHTPHLYILGGDNGISVLSECERYVCAENRWEALPPLPRACMSTSGVVLENSLYALGGFDETFLDWVQKLSLESLTWELMQFRLSTLMGRSTLAHGG